MGRKPMPEALRGIQRKVGTLRTMGDIEYFAREKAVNARLLMSLWLLHDKFGFGNKRLMRFMDEMNTLADEMNAKLLDEKGIVKALKSECDLEIMM